MNESLRPLDAWSREAGHAFSDKPAKIIKSYQGKHFPKESFLCIVEEGLINGIRVPTLRHVKCDSLNWQYVLDVIRHLLEKDHTYKSLVEEERVGVFREPDSFVTRPTTTRCT